MPWTVAEVVELLLEPLLAVHLVNSVPQRRWTVPQGLVNSIYPCVHMHKPTHIFGVICIILTLGWKDGCVC